VTRGWPFSALGVWLLAMLPWRWLPPGAAALLSLGVLAAGAWLHRAAWRRFIVLAGAPLALLLHSAPVPPWAWAGLALLLLLLYPWRHWGDAPLFHTPDDAFAALPAVLPLPDGARLLDAGCGAGAALRAWARAYPQLRLHGVEASWLLCWWARWRCPAATLAQGDLWDCNWGDYEIVYLFQRPETMARARDKARQQMRAGSHLVSLDFALPGTAPALELPVGRHRVLVYRVDALN
jgi:hypothetical protein